MKIVHIASTDIRGGASRGSYWLHQALGDMGIESVMLVGRKYSDDESVIQLAGKLAPIEERVRGALDVVPLRPYRKTDDSFWTVGWLPRAFRRKVAALQPDLIHFHWTGAGFMPIDALRGLPCPLVWTLRDMWAFTGGCHYTAGCLRYEFGCGRCPQLCSNDDNDLSHKVWTQKYDSWSPDINLTLVPTSRWLADCARNSPLFRNVPSSIIPNGVDDKQFRPIPMAQARQTLGLDQGKRYVLFGAIGALEDERKGFAHLCEAVIKLSENGWDRKIELLVFGNADGDVGVPLGIKTHFLGAIYDDERLANLYASADVMITPSLQEAFGKTLIEAMACGTPVVAFNHGGPADIVVHRKTGYLAEPFDPNDLADGIAWCLEDSRRTTALGENARRRVERRYNLDVIARSYTDLYQGILGAPA